VGHNFSFPFAQMVPWLRLWLLWCVVLHQEHIGIVFSKFTWHVSENNKSLRCLLS